MDSTEIRGGVGDESHTWTEICVGFSRTRDEAGRYGLDTHWRALVDATRQGNASIEDWIEFLAEIAELRDAEEDFASRSGTPAARVRAAADGGYVCPWRLCGRHVTSSPFRATPRCALLCQDMVELAD